MSKQTRNDAAFYGIDWINAVDFGLIGDGVTPNDTKMKEYIDNYADIPIYFPKGVYCFENSLDFPLNMYMHLDPAAELKCIAKEPLDFFITVRKDATRGGPIDYYSKSYIKGGVINANYCARTGLATCLCHHPKFEGFMIKNVLEKGIWTMYNSQNIKQGAFTARDLIIYNDKAIPGTVGIYDHFVDTNVYGTTIINFETGIYTHGGRFYECTAWVNSGWIPGGNVDNFENLTFAVVNRGHQSLFVNCTIDTMRYGFRLNPEASVTVNNVIWFTNTVFYTPEAQAKYPRTAFYCEDPSKALFYVVGAQVPSDEYFQFCNGDMPESAFLNIRGSNKIPYFRNDTDILKSYVSAATVKLNSASDFDTVVASGNYVCDLLTGENGNNVPPVREKGVLEVAAAGDMVTQKFYGTSTSASRVFDGTAWGQWVIVGA